MKKLYAIFLLMVLSLVFSIPASAEDGPVSGPSQIWGFGLVVGLNGTGDVKNSRQTLQALAGLLEQNEPGLPGNPNYYKPGNVARVTIIADLPPNFRPGDKMDAFMAALGDATDLRGGILLPATLRGADDRVYALAQGTISDEMVGLEGLGGFEGPFTRARLANGATVNGPTLTAHQKDNAIRLIVE